MNIKQMTLAVLTAATGAAMAVMPEVSNVTMTQVPNRLVTITYQLVNAPAVVTLDIETNANPSAAADDAGWTSIGGRAICNAQGDVWKKVGESGTFNGTITWRPDQAWTDEVGNGFKIAANGARARVTAWPLDNTPAYMVVDISDAATAATEKKYYPAAGFVPNGVTNSLYKTTMLLMRKIMAKDVTWTMGSTPDEPKRTASKEGTHQVTLTNNYYIGVYEVTQSQWGLVATNSTAAAIFTAERSMRPMEKLSYNEIRNAANTYVANAAYNWPNDPNPSSFLGLLRLKTGIDFDLPSEAQWEFAARAGHGSGYWNDGSPILTTEPDANLNRLGRYLNNPSSNSSATPTATMAPADGGTAIVGSYEPNDWGLYDMHGNVWEWCLDWYQADIATATDVSGNNYNGRVNIDPSNSANYLSGESASGKDRVRRGGNWNKTASDCRSAFRGQYGPAERGTGNGNGFRVVCTAGLQ